MRYFERPLAEKNDVPNGCKSDAADRESVSMLNPIRPPRTEKGQNCANGVNWNCVELGA